MFLLELRNQRRHREEIVTADVEHELRIGDVAVKIGQSSTWGTVNSKPRFVASLILPAPTFAAQPAPEAEKFPPWHRKNTMPRTAASSSRSQVDDLAIFTATSPIRSSCSTSA